MQLRSTGGTHMHYRSVVRYEAQQRIQLQV